KAIRESKKCSEASTIFLSSPGGSVAAAIAIGRILRKERLSVLVPYDGACYSACVLIYAGAVTRVVAGKLGIHRPYFSEVPQRVSSENVKTSYQGMLQDIRSYFREMNVSDQLADDMLRIDPDKIRLLDSAEIERYGLSFTDPVEQETKDLEDAQYWGV